MNGYIRILFCASKYSATAKPSASIGMTKLQITKVDQNETKRTALEIRLAGWSTPEMLIVCALAHIGATFKVKWLLENVLCAFRK